jgi:hypothetical protein
VRLTRVNCTHRAAAKKHKKNKRKDAASAPDKQRDAELELLITDLKPAQDTLEPARGRPLKRHKASADSAEFALDPRFGRMASDPRFAIDPTNPQAKKTTAASAINQVKQQRRVEAPASAQERPLSSLVAAVKHNTQQHQGHKKKH